MFEKALKLPADSLILDLEDSVTPSNKEVPGTKFVIGSKRLILKIKNA